MWFFLGIVSFTLAAIYFYNQNIGQPNKYKSFKSYYLNKKTYRANSGNAQNELRLSFFNSKQTLEVAVELNTILRFTLKPEKKSDRWAKKIGLSIEPQTGNNNIDDSFYLICHENFVAKKLNDSHLETKFHSLVKREFLGTYADHHGAVGRLNKASMQLAEIRSTGNYFSVKYNLLEPINNIIPIQERLAEICFEIAEILEQHQDKHGYQWWKDKGNYKSAFFLSISSSLGLLGIFEYFRFVLNSQNSTVINFLPLNIAWLISLPCILLMLAATVISVMKRSANTHIILKDMLIVGGLGLFAYSYSLVYDINMLLDNSQPVLQTTLVEHKKTIRTTGKHARTYYKIYFSPPLKVGGELNEINVDSDLYENLEKNDCLNIFTKSGLLKATWIYKLEKGAVCSLINNYPK